MVNLYRVTKSLLAGRISEKTAGLMLWSVAIGMPGARKSRSRKTYRGDTETRRKSKNLPRIHADDRGSGTKQLANSNWQLAESKTESKSKTFETQRNGGSRGGTKLGRELTRKSAGHSGVTQRKSFVSGMAGQVAPGTKRSGTKHGENALKRHGRTRHSRDVSTPPHSPSQARGRSESLIMTRSEGIETLQTIGKPALNRIPPCLRASVVNKGLRTTKHAGGANEEE